MTARFNTLTTLWKRLRRWPEKTSAAGLSAYVYTDHPVDDRLFFAARRLHDLRLLNHGNLASASHRDRQPLVQEFFFHLVGAIEFLAQEANTKRGLGLAEHRVSPASVAESLPTGDRLRVLLEVLHPDVGRPALPADPYSDEACHYRIIVYRNYVTHIRHNPFVFRMGAEPPASFRLDPRYPIEGNKNISERDAYKELGRFLKLVTIKCQEGLQLLK